jgi:hypothetical protein
MTGVHEGHLSIKLEIRKNPLIESRGIESSDLILKFLHAQWAPHPTNQQGRRIKTFGPAIKHENNPKVILIFKECIKVITPKIM